MDAKTLHDLRTPLTVIRCQTQMVQRQARKGPDPDKARILASLDVIDRMVSRLCTTIATLEDTPSSG